MHGLSTAGGLKMRWGQQATSRGFGKAAFAKGAIIASLVLGANATYAAGPYAWTNAGDRAASTQTLADMIAPPAGFRREPAKPGSFEAWLRGLPMKPAGSPVLLHTGGLKPRQDVHAAVIDIDIGKRDLQQCADAIMRLRGEWLFGTGRKREITFNYTDGKPRRFKSYKRQDYKGFKRYMTLVFAYAGTYSLERELKKAKLEDLNTGDVFIKGGFPGHAVLVIDTAVNPDTGEKRFLLMQSYMPAQSMHILKNPDAIDGSPWYDVPKGLMLRTPEWNFPVTALKRW